MTDQDFHHRWNLHYPETGQLAHLFKHIYAHRWFRIHSLPASKRYAENKDERCILLQRQNEIITDLLGHDTSVFMVTGDYHRSNQESTHLTAQEPVLQPYSFTLLNNIHLQTLDGEQYDGLDVYRPAFAAIIWQPAKHDALLTAIANNEANAFFVSFHQPLIIAPYDGGIDIVLKDVLTKEFYKRKYSAWLSAREDGL
jgi:hypothetical protein